jgi:hypothetical protein
MIEPDRVKRVELSARDVFARYSEALDRADLATMAALVHDAFWLEGAGFDRIGKQHSWQL